jgi:hypothetical protein
MLCEIAVTLLADRSLQILIRVGTNSARQSFYLPTYGSTALYWALDLFQFLDLLHSR